MRINQNIAALNAWRNLNITDRKMGKTMEKLSSGLRINRAADDAAGLAISERMRSQVSGLEQAVSNAQNGISLIQTAEGALDETHAILNRIREITIQAANEVNDRGDLEKIQDEVSTLIEEIDRIAQTTEFNTKALINGTIDGIELQIGANSGQSIEIDLRSMDSEALGLSESGENLICFFLEGTEENDGSGNGEEIIEKIHYVEMTGDAEDHPHYEEILTQGNIVQQAFIKDGEFFGEEYDIPEEGRNTGTGDVIYLETAEGDYEVGDIATGTYFDSEGDLLIEEGDEFLGEKEGGTGNVISNTQFGNLIEKLDNAIDGVSEFRSKLGASQNRLEHTINNLDVARENLSAAESRVRDADMASEMMTLTRHRIMQQAGTAMLAQANMRPQALLQLLG